MTTLKDFSTTLKLVRAARGLGQNELGEIAGIDPTQISRYESGPHPEHVKALEKALNFSFDKDRLSDILSGDFGTELRVIRKDKGLLQAELGELTGIQQTTISLYERGEKVPLSEHIKALERVLNYRFVSLEFPEAA